MVLQLTLVLVLVLLNAAFAGTELALVSLREGQLQRLEKRSSTGALLARLAREPNEFFATIQIGITLAGFLASAFAAVSLAEPLEDPLGFLGGAARPVSVLVVTIVLSFLTLVIGELAPKRLAMQRAERWGLVMARPLSFLARITRPVVWLLSLSTDVVVRLAGGDPAVQREEVTEEELRDLVATQPVVDDDQRRIIEGAFEIADRPLGRVLVPRQDVFLLDASASARDALVRLAESGHSRAPVAEDGDLDRVVGVVHLRQLLDTDAEVSAVMIDIPVFPDSVRALPALRRLQEERVQMALVVDEHGRATGIVTVEDLVEELVGEIWDETDADLDAVVHRDDGSLLVPGRFPVHGLVAIGVELPEGDYTTLAGLVLQRVGTIPAAGDVVEVDGWTLEVESMRGRAIAEVAVTAPVP